MDDMQEVSLAGWWVCGIPVFELYDYVGAGDGVEVDEFLGGLGEFGELGEE